MRPASPRFWSVLIMNCWPSLSSTLEPCMGPTRSLGPCRSSMTPMRLPTVLPTSCSVWISRRTSSRSVCPLLTRATSMPASVIRPRTSGSCDDGPIVQTIFALIPEWSLAIFISLELSPPIPHVPLNARAP